MIAVFLLSDCVSYFKGLKPKELLRIYTPPFLLLATKLCPESGPCLLKQYLWMAVSVNSDLEVQTIAKFLLHGKREEFQDFCGEVGRRREWYYRGLKENFQKNWSMYNSYFYHPL